MPLPNLSDVCVAIKVTPQNLSVTFPGGAEMAVQLPDTGIPDPMQLAKQMMAQANAALAPLVPVFNIIDTVMALFKTAGGSVLESAEGRGAGTIAIERGKVTWSVRRTRSKSCSAVGSC